MPRTKSAFCKIVLGLVAGSLICFVEAGSGQGEEPSARIRPYVENPCYWQYKGRPVLLLGGSDDDNLFQFPDLEAHLDLLASVGGNYIRNTMSARPDREEVQAFKQLSNGKYDLDQWNEEYWQRFENLLAWCEEREIIIQIEVWDRFDYTDNKAIKYWQACPYHPARNINYTFEESGFAERYPDHPGADKQPFFHTIPGTRNYRPKYDLIRKYQERYVEKMLSHTLPRGNVLYCMNNETSTPSAWGLYWMHFIRERAARQGAPVYVTDMFDRAYVPQRCAELLTAIDTPEEYMFLDISQINSRNFNEDHWDVLQWIRHRTAGQPPRPLNCTKVYGSGYKSFGTGGPEDGVERFFRNMIGGCASMRFHRPDSGNGLGPVARASIRAARKLNDRVPMWEVEPRGDLLSQRETDEAYLAAAPGEKYALYFTDGGSVGLDLTAAAGRFRLEWITIATGEPGDSAVLEGGRVVTLAAPGPGGYVAAITKTN